MNTAKYSVRMQETVRMTDYSELLDCGLFLKTNNISYSSHRIVKVFSVSSNYVNIYE